MQEWASAVPRGAFLVFPSPCMLLGAEGQVEGSLSLSLAQGQGCLQAGACFSKENHGFTTKPVSGGRGSSGMDGDICATSQSWNPRSLRLEKIPRISEAKLCLIPSPEH